jgi:DNA-binding NarL/FixJ family response regulator
MEHEVTIEGAGGELSAKRRKIFVVDDHPLVREWLTNLINQQPDLVVCGEAESAASAKEGILAQKPDAAVVDISLKDSSGIQLIKELKALRPELTVIVLSMHEESHYAERALFAGARGYIIKRESTKKVIGAIRDVLEGKLFLSPSIATAMVEHLVAARGGDVSAQATILSDREMQVFELLGQGRGTRQIGESLGINLKTVQAYCARIKEKINVDSATELLRAAVRFHDAKEK